MKVIFSSLDKNKALGGWQETAVYIEEALQEAELDFHVIRPPNPAKVHACNVFYEGTFTSQFTMGNIAALRAASPKAVFILQLINAHPSVYRRIYQDELQRYGLSDERFSASWFDTFSDAVAKADVIFCHSEWIKKSLIENRKREDAIDVIPKGVDTSFWTPAPRPKEVFRVGFAGQLQIIKGLQHLLEAWKKLDYGNSAELWIAGPMVGYVVNGQRTWSCGRVFGSGLALSNVFYKGWYRDRVALRAFYNSLDVFVVPSLEDGWCMTAVEAMACEKPVIVTPTTGMSQIIRIGKNGFIVPPRAPDALAEKIEWFRTHPDSVVEWGATARRTVLHYDIPTYKRNFTSALLARGGKQ